VCVGYLGFLVGTEIIDEGNIMGHLDNLITWASVFIYSHIWKQELGISRSLEKTAQHHQTAE
jgi:hypothetical protein